MYTLVNVSLATFGATLLVVAKKCIDQSPTDKSSEETNSGQQVVDLSPSSPNQHLEGIFQRGFTINYGLIFLVVGLDRLATLERLVLIELWMNVRLRKKSSLLQTQ